MKLKRIGLLIIAGALLGALFAGCGESDSSGSKATADGAAASNVDAAFVAAMIPHHESAVEMSQIAGENAEHAEIKELAQSINKSQTAEIADLKQLAEQLPESDGSSMMSNGEMMKMHDDVAGLSDAKEFDKAFIDAMIPHHQSAVSMANQVLANGSNAEVKALATAIVKAQSKEISDMQSWRVEWYGEPLRTESSDSMHSMH